MQEKQYDALIIGGGPGGSTAASYLARAGKQVLLLEKEVFPRFHIGESLLPYNRRIFEEIGVLPKLEALGLVRKFGAQFLTDDGSHALMLLFRNGKFTRETEAFQVERATFDHTLLQHAADSGATVREGWTVTRYLPGRDQIGVEARGPQGESRQFTARFLIDASGRSNLTGNQDQQRRIHPRMRKVAIFSHFTGVRLDEGPTQGDTIIVRLADKWFWLIPLTAEKVSIGCVLDQSELSREKSTPAELFDQIWRSSPALVQRMAQARAVAPIQVTSDFSYHNDRFSGHRLLRVGDAAGFMDPIFSAGVYLAMATARHASQAVLETLSAGNDGRARFRRYHSQVQRALHYYWRMAEAFYTQSFVEVFLTGREKWQLASAVNALLAGELEGDWKLRMRIRLFFLIVRLQRRWELVPRISFAAAPRETLPLAQA